MESIVHEKREEEEGAAAAAAATTARNRMMVKEEKTKWEKRTEKRGNCGRNGRSIQGARGVTRGDSEGSRREVTEKN